MATRCVRAALVVASGLMAVSLAVPVASAQAAILALRTPSPQGFVPAWDGERDSTAIRVSAGAGGRLTVTVRDSERRVVRYLALRRPVHRGALTLMWDGRTATGEVVPAGTYSVEALLRLAHPATAGASATASGGARLVRRRAGVEVRAPRVSITGLATSRGYISGRQSARRVTMRFRMSRRGYLSAAVARPDGTVVRNLLRGRSLGAGRGAVTWDGSDDHGVRVADGNYLLLLSGSTGRDPTNTLRAPVLVDTSRPGLRLRARTILARVRHGRVVFALPLSLTEGGRVTASRARRAHSVGSLLAGQRRVIVQGSDLGIRPARVARVYRVRLSVADRVGNVRSIVVKVRVPATRTPAAPPPAAPEPVTPPGGGDLAWPAHGVLTSNFGQRWGRLHAGIDIGAPTGTPIMAAAGGIVSFAGTEGGYGNLVVVEHPGGLSTAYAHQSRIGVVVGQVLDRGDLVGYVGSTGNSTGPHLHFETRVNGIALDPLRFLPAGGPPA